MCIYHYGSYTESSHLLFNFLTKYYTNIHIINNNNKKAEKQVNKLLTLLHLKLSEELS